MPPDVAVCAVVSDLRGHWQKLDQAAWFKALRASPLVQGVISGPEFRDVLNFERDLKQYLQVDWPTLRDDVVGECVVFAYRPPGPGQDDEQGLFLIKARNEGLLKRLIDRVNELQRQAGELKELEPRKHLGVTYYRRVHDKNTHFYFQQGAVLAITAKEDIIKAVIAQKSETPAPIYQALHCAGADKALAAVWLNPRVFDAELQLKAKQKIEEGKTLEGFLAYWRALDGVVVSCDVGAHLEARLTLLTRTADLPPAARKWLEQPPQASALWSYFPPNAVLSIAGRTELRELIDNLAGLAPPAERKMLLDAAQRTLGPRSEGRMSSARCCRISGRTGACASCPRRKDSRCRRP